MSGIRERDAEWRPIRPGPEWTRNVPTRDDHPFADAVDDRRALLTAGDALAEAADEVAWPWRDLLDPAASPMTRLLAAIAAWKATTG